MKKIMAIVVSLLLVVSTSTVANRATGVLMVSTTIPMICVISSQSRSVGQYNSLTNYYDVISSITMKCNNGTSYVIRHVEQLGNSPGQGGRGIGSNARPGLSPMMRAYLESLPETTESTGKDAEALSEDIQGGGTGYAQVHPVYINASPELFTNESKKQGSRIIMLIEY